MYIQFADLAPHENAIKGFTTEVLKLIDDIEEGVYNFPSLPPPFSATMNSCCTDAGHLPSSTVFWVVDFQGFKNDNSEFIKRVCHCQGFSVCPIRFLSIFQSTTFK